MDEEKTLVEQALELIENKKYAALKQILKHQEPADIGEIFEELSPEHVALVYRLLPKELAADVFVEMEPENQELLINSFNDTELRAMLDELSHAGL